MTPWEASADQLIAAGWGDVERHKIPDDWLTRQAPKTPGRNKESYRNQRPKRMTWRQRRALYLLENAAGRGLEGNS
jgi:hypothetical protein